MGGSVAAATTTGVCLLAIVDVDGVFKMKMDLTSTSTEPLKSGVEILGDCRLKYQKTEQIHTKIVVSGNPFEPFYYTVWL